MRTLIAALGLTALAAGPALAQTGVARASAGTGATATTTAAAAGTNAGATAGTTTTGTLNDPVLTSPGAPVGDAGGSSAIPSGGANTAFGTNQTTDINADTPGSSFGPNGPFSNDSGNTALGTSPGQTSSGTFAGNSSIGIGADSSTLNNGTIGNDTGVTTVPEGNVSVIGGGGSGARVVGVPSAVGSQGTAAGSTPTPLFDQAAREGRAKEARRRARGEEPRVYGIAPNTERDLTWQMPDDKIIRY